MKKYVLFCLFCLLPAALGADISRCTCTATPLYGRCPVVDHFVEFIDQVLTSLPDLRVQKVPAFADSCGKWQMVDSFADFTIQYVDAFPDFTIQFVDAFPGQ